MTPEQRERLEATARELRQDAEHLREDDECDGEADHNEALADAIDAAIKQIERLEVQLKFDRTQFASYAKHCRDCAWNATATEFETYAGLCGAALEGRD